MLRTFRFAEDNGEWRIGEIFEALSESDYEYRFECTDDTVKKIDKETGNLVLETSPNEMVLYCAEAILEVHYENEDLLTYREIDYLDYYSAIHVAHELILLEVESALEAELFDKDIYMDGASDRVEEILTKIF